MEFQLNFIIDLFLWPCLSCMKLNSKRKSVILTINIIGLVQIRFKPYRNNRLHEMYEFYHVKQKF